VTAAIFALAGALIGVLGTLAVEVVRNRAEDRRSDRETIRLTCADFTASVARMVNFSIQVKNPDADYINKMREAHVEARASYERLRLISGSREVQEAGRHVLRYSFGLLRRAGGKPPRTDELERGPSVMLQDWLIRLYVEVRKEMGIPHPEDVYREPDAWLEPSSAKAPIEEAG
jgi:hypothetical protein